MNVCVCSFAGLAWSVRDQKLLSHHPFNPDMSRCCSMVHCHFREGKFVGEGCLYESISECSGDKQNMFQSTKWKWTLQPFQLEYPLQKKNASSCIIYHQFKDFYLTYSAVNSPSAFWQRSTFEVTPRPWDSWTNFHLGHLLECQNMDSRTQCIQIYRGMKKYSKFKYSTLTNTKQSLPAGFKTTLIVDHMHLWKQNTLAWSGIGRMSASHSVRFRNYEENSKANSLSLGILELPMYINFTQQVNSQIPSSNPRKCLLHSSEFPNIYT